MSKRAGLVPVLGAFFCLAACAGPSEDGAAATSAASSASAQCNLMWLRFDNIDLLHDLEKTLSPQFSHDGKVNVPGGLEAETDSGAFTAIVTVLDAKVSIDHQDGAASTKTSVEISGGFPDVLGGDHAAHHIFDAMTRGSVVEEWKRVSKDGHFECHVEGWKGGNLYICTFPDVMDAHVTSSSGASSGLCAAPAN
jgi:hypothetical protein